MTETIFTYKHQKFYNDSIKYENELFEVETHGVFYDCKQTLQQQLGEFIIDEYKKKGEKFAVDLRGSFFISLHDKTHRTKLIYTNHIGDQRVFYHTVGENTIVSNSIKTIVDTLKARNQSVSLNMRAAYYMLTFGYMLHDTTLVSNIKRLKPGHYIKIEGDRVSILPYYLLNNKPDTSITENDAVEELDLLFRQAVRRAFEKDIDYNYSHLTTLSGGLDSRMTTWIAHEMGYKNITGLTFSQTDYLDQTVAQQIAMRLNMDWIFKSLDHGNFLTNVEPVIKISEGLGTYSGQTHGKSVFDCINFDNFGVMHTGMIGDVIISSFISGNRHEQPQLAKATSDRLFQKIYDEDLSAYENQEQFLMYNRGFNGATTGHGPMQQFTEVESPFLDVDFMNYALQIPLKLRKNHYLYKKFIIKKYPGAAQYPWEAIGAKITTPTVSINKKEVPVTQLHKFVQKGLSLRLGLVDKTAFNSNKHMNPFDYWYKTNRQLPAFFNNYYNENLHLIDDKELRADCDILFNGTVTEKMQVLSLLAAIKLFWH